MWLKNKYFRSVSDYGVVEFWEQQLYLVIAFHLGGLETLYSVSHRLRSYPWLQLQKLVTNLVVWLVTYCCIAVTSDGLHSWQNCNASPAVNCVSLTLSVTIIMFMCKLLKAAIKYSNYVKSWYKFQIRSISCNIEVLKTFHFGFSE